MAKTNWYTKITPERLAEASVQAGLGGDTPCDLLEIIRCIPPTHRRILEVGCGTGRLGMHLISRYDYRGIDTNATYLDVFKKKLQCKNIAYKDEQIQEVSFFAYQERNHDVVLFPWSILCDFARTEQEQALRHARALLRENGIVVLDNPAPGSAFNNPPEYNPTMFYFDEWSNRFKTLGFPQSSKAEYTTASGRRREIVVLRVA